MSTASHGVTLKNFKFAAFASEETNCFTADVCIDGTKIGTASNDGHGGPNNYYPPSAQRELERRASRLPDLVDERYQIEGKPMVLKMDADLLIDDLVQNLIAQREVRRLTKSKVVMLCTDGAIRQTKKLPADKMQSLLALGHEALCKKWSDAVKILNLLPFDEAVHAYRKGV